MKRSFHPLLSPPPHHYSQSSILETEYEYSRRGRRRRVARIVVHESFRDTHASFAESLFLENIKIYQCYDYHIISIRASQRQCDTAARSEGSQSNRDRKIISLVARLLSSSALASCSFSASGLLLRGHDLSVGSISEFHSETRGS